MSSTTNQSTQYNTIASAYASHYPPQGTSNLPCAVFEEAQLYATLTKPWIDIRGKRVLDLACGNGFYSTRYLQWGATSVTGVDISQSMVETAKTTADAQGIPESKLRYMVGDVTDPSLKVDGEFDIVTSAWLLNYAPDVPTMTRMWDTVARHLKAGGRFVALTIPPLLSVRRDKLAFEQETGMIANACLLDGAWGKYGCGGRVLGPVEDGLKMEIELGLEGLGDQLAAFECYYLGIEAFEESIKACVVEGNGQAFDGVEWQDIVVPVNLKKGRPVGYWNDASLCPLCRVLITTRL